MQMEGISDERTPLNVDMSRLSISQGPTEKSCKKKAKKKKPKRVDLIPEQQDIFRVVEGIDKKSENSVSFLFRKSSWLLRAKNDECIIEPKKSMRHFEKECSFFPMIDLWYPGYVSFESTEKAAHYLRLKDGHLTLDRYDATNGFKEDASFLLRKKNADGADTADNIRKKINSLKDTCL